ncbi:glycosyltransferase [Oleidesulfovibrio alaskensis]|jgi:GT2 family glycosyltransferase|uniref:glycosyltransferase n=1 Tax=Oleidesulfovibrio alaskensis TaxID=58180 RepID=UPI001A46339F|nr:glycosyltransferase [Oleidesulfovibrio alaskensis]MBL3582319.1 glycosyltransferase [Oleidesulfovibrio alaskensis]
MKLSFVIVTRNVNKYIGSCLESVFGALADVSALGAEAEIFVVDNASADGTARSARNAGSAVTVIENTTDTGFAAAANKALRQATGDLVFFLDPRTEVLPGSLRRMLDHMETHTDCAIAGGKVVDKKELTVRGARRLPGFLTKFTEAFGLAAMAPATCLNHAAYGGRRMEQPAEVQSVPFSFACVRMEAFRCLGPLDERFFGGFADTDFCRRVHKALNPARKTAYVPQARVRLLDGFAMKQEVHDFDLYGTEVVRHRVRSEMMYVWKNYCILTSAANTLLDLAAHSLRFCVNILPVVGDCTKSRHNAVVIKETALAMIDTQLGTQYPATPWE